MASDNNEKETGVIGKVYENGLPVIYAFVNEDPTQENIARFSSLTIISWEYDGSNNNGMPEEEINMQMLTLEDALSQEFENSTNSMWVFNRTGNNLKEFAYYINSRDKFIEDLNKALSSHPQFPIDIKFYDDPNWLEITQLLKEFNSNG
jgi:hypothetical protein